MKYNKLTFISAVMLTITMCVPPADTGATTAQDKKRLDSLRNVRCPRLMSSAAEYYRNRDWKQTVKIYEEITTLDCDCLLYTSPSPRDRQKSRMPSSA